MLIWDGNSRIGEGAPVSAVATFNSANVKTGNMVQTWILANDKKPTEALRDGTDANVCGDCKHREGSCYVNVGQAPNSVWKKLDRGGYPEMDLDAFRGRNVRFGSYGDPAAVDSQVWEDIAGVCKSNTGYTHQWMSAPGLKDLCMASVDTPDEYELAKDMGWRTFRVFAPGEDLRAGEILCPSNRGVKCEDCGMCGGLQSKHGVAKDIAIEVHGSAGKINKFKGISVELKAA